ncbi:DegPprotease 7, partial [Striga asiatica]
MGPEIPLLVKSTDCKLGPESKSGGRVPVSLLKLRSKLVRYERARRPEIDPGISPVRLLIDSTRVCSLLSVPNSSGIGPERLLMLKSTRVRFRYLVMFGGIWPWKLLQESWSSSKRLARPRLVGTRPVNLFSVNPGPKAGNGPSSLFLLKFKDLNKLGCWPQGSKNALGIEVRRLLDTSRDSKLGKLHIYVRNSEVERKNERKERPLTEEWSGPQSIPPQEQGFESLVTFWSGQKADQGAAGMKPSSGGANTQT